MTVGELADMLKSLSAAEAKIPEWEEAIEGWGDDGRKHLREARLAEAKEMVARLRAVVIPN